ncbi:hypothetical protein M8J75_005930 [Diaphorina citri]|nr:hypothetical protein M8J75_005930 [Diaphorina citri]
MCRCGDRERNRFISNTTLRSQALTGFIGCLSPTLLICLISVAVSTETDYDMEETEIPAALSSDPAYIEPKPLDARMYYYTGTRARAALTRLIVLPDTAGTNCPHGYSWLVNGCRKIYELAGD